MFRPKSVNIFSNVFPIAYVDQQIKADIDGRKELYGQIDYLSQSIRIFDNGKIGEAEILHTILEEVTHAITDYVRIDMKHEDLTRLTKCLADVLIRNGWIKEEVYHG